MFTLEDAITYIIEHTEPVSDCWGLLVYDICGAEYAIGNDEDADEAVTNYIKESVWAFNPDFLCIHMLDGKLTSGQITALRGDSCEDVNDSFLAMIDDFDAFVEDAVSTDGRGHFLATYDGVEHECGDYYVYRIN